MPDPKTRNGTANNGTVARATLRNTAALCRRRSGGVNAGRLTRLISRFKNSDLGSLRSSMWHREKQATFVRTEKGGARASRRRNMGEARYWSGGADIQHVDETLSADHIETFPLRIEEQVIGIADDVCGGGLLSSRRVVDEHLRGPAASDEHAVVCFV